MNITGLYNSKMLTYIELTLKDVSEPPKRDIPRPRHRPRPPELPREIKRLEVKKNPIPHFKPIKVDSAEREFPDSIVEHVNLPDIPQDLRLNITDWFPPEELVAESDYATPNRYMEMVRLRIEKYKRYPSLARVKNMEGIVTIRFIITLGGKTKAIEIAKSSSHKILDRAALRAVKDASPFPKPPSEIYKGDLTLEIDIVFELT